MLGSWTPARSFAKVWAQFNHNWNVAVQVKPITIKAILSIVNLELRIFSNKPGAFSPSFLAAFGIGAKATRIPMTIIAAPLTYNSKL